MRNANQGFTLIELIMVIVILGILAAFALPRFADFGQSARIASLQGLEGSLKSSAAIAHSVHLVNGTAVNAQIQLEGLNITMRNGYPRANASGIDRAANVSGFAASGGGGGANATRTYNITGYTAGAGGCNVTYQAANPNQNRPSPVITRNDGGC